MYFKLREKIYYRLSNELIFQFPLLLKLSSSLALAHAFGGQDAARTYEE
jgi:hypothetical protein